MSRTVGIVGIISILVVAMSLALWNRMGSVPHKQPTYDEQLAACKALPNNSVQTERETSRLFINLPRNTYPSDVRPYFKTIRGDATAGYVSNGGLPGQAFEATENCSSTYVEFDGSGEVDLTVPSAAGAPEYFIRFIVNKI